MRVARRLAARDRVDHLTMRRLAAALGVMPNALYTYFPDKASILDAVLDDLIGDVERPSARVGWRRGLAALMRSYRAVLLSEPGLIPLTVSRPMLGPNAMRLREDMLALLLRRDLDGGTAVDAYLSLFAYTTGFVAFEAGRAPGEGDRRQRGEAREMYAALSDEDFPATRALARRLTERAGDREFERGLASLLAGFAAPGRR